MKKVAVVFIVAVFVPSLVLAWLAVRSLHDQQFVLERQRALLYQNVADSLVKDWNLVLSDLQREFAVQVDTYLTSQSETNLVSDFSTHLKRQWPVAELGFNVSLRDGLMSPSPAAGVEARAFCADNGAFLANREVAEVYWNTLAPGNNGAVNSYGQNSSRNYFGNQGSASSAEINQTPAKFQNRKVTPLEQNNDAATPPPNAPAQQLQSLNNIVSKIAPADTEFRQLVGTATDGVVARFVQNRLRLLFWHRSQPTQDMIYGAQIDLRELTAKFALVIEPTFRDDISVALLDDATKPRVRSDNTFTADWKRPFVAAEFGEALPHWEVAVYLRDPAKLNALVRTTRLTLGLLIGILVIAIAIGSWLIVRDLDRQLTLARQKTDFVSNVSHELKTPLTSIRMFSELLADGRVNDAEKQRSYLNIISAETARLTRLINNVLDFARMERGEKSYQMAPCHLAGLVSETAETFRPQLEAAGFDFAVTLPEQAITIQADRDAVAQILVNLLSNAEKYSGSTKEIRLSLCATPTHAELQVMDRGPGVPQGCEEKIFTQFFRANDSLTNAIPGSGLGLTLARQIAQAHGGALGYSPRPGGGSCFTLRLPLSPLSA